MARLERVEGNGALDLAAISHSPDELLETQVPDAAARGDIVKNTTTDAPLTARRLWLTSPARSPTCTASGPPGSPSTTTPSPPAGTSTSRC